MKHYFRTESTLRKYFNKADIEKLAAEYPHTNGDHVVRCIDFDADGTLVIGVNSITDYYYDEDTDKLEVESSWVWYKPFWYKDAYDDIYIDVEDEGCGQSWIPAECMLDADEIAYWKNYLRDEDDDEEEVVA